MGTEQEWYEMVTSNFLLRDMYVGLLRMTISSMELLEDCGAVSSPI